MTIKKQVKKSTNPPPRSQRRPKMIDARQPSKATLHTETKAIRTAERKASHAKRKTLSRRLVSAWNKAFRITNELVDEAGVRHVTDRQARELGLRAPAEWNLAGLLFPYPDPTTGDMAWCRVRRDVFDKDNGEGKYHSSSGDRVVYVISSSLERLKQKGTKIVIVEAEKSVLAIEQYLRRNGITDVIVMAVGGCQGWQDKKHGVIPGLELCDGCSVIIMFDANVRTNPLVREAREGLAAELRSRKCEVTFAELPQIKGVNGPDDLLAQPNGDELMTDVLAKATESAIAPYSEHALAERFAIENKDNYRHVSGLGWHWWDDSRWQRDEQGKVELAVQELCKTAAIECAKLHEQNRIRSRRTREAVLREAQVHLSIRHDALDKNPMLLNTPGGAVDLLTGTMHTAQREDYCTKLTGIAPSNKKPALWLKFLKEITVGDKKLETYIQRAIGYTLTGSTIEHAMFFLYGTGANGKSVFMNTLLTALSDYARTAPMEAFVVSHHPQHATSIAALRGARLVAANETEDGSRWAESKVKELTGGTPITARFMRQDEFTFSPQLKLWVAGNCKPRLRGIDVAMRRRLHLIPFTAYFSEDKRDPRLAEKLQAELGGILQWAIEGCLAWHREGLCPPRVVTDATEEYFESQDVLGTWLEEVTQKGATHKEYSGELYASYKRWTEAKGEYVFCQREFVQKLTERGFSVKKSNGVRLIVGLRMRRAGSDGADKTIPFPKTIKEPKFAARR